MASLEGGLKAALGQRKDTSAETVEAVEHHVEEVAIFVLPTAAEHGGPHAHMPEMAAVFAVKDAAKSEAIWNQILAIATLVGVRDTNRSR